MSDPWHNLEALHVHLWARLARGAGDAGDAFRLCALATVGPAGPEARTVALRRADVVKAEVEMHSDSRTPKVAQLYADPRAALLFWDAETQVQLRLRAVLTVVGADPVRWAGVPSAARGNYGTDPAPGTAIVDPDTLTRSPDPARFAALVGRVTGMEAVSLAHDPHRRAAFDGDGSRWIAP